MIIRVKMRKYLGSYFSRKPNYIDILDIGVLYVCVCQVSKVKLDFGTSGSAWRVFFYLDFLLQQVEQLTFHRWCLKVWCHLNNGDHVFQGLLPHLPRKSNAQHYQHCCKIWKKIWFQNQRMNYLLNRNIPGYLRKNQIINGDDIVLTLLT